MFVTVITKLHVVICQVSDCRSPFVRPSESSLGRFSWRFRFPLPELPGVRANLGDVPFLHRVHDDQAEPGVPEVELGAREDDSTVEVEEAARGYCRVRAPPDELELAAACQLEEVEVQVALVLEILELGFILHLVQTVHRFLVQPPCHPSFLTLALEPLPHDSRFERAQIEPLGGMKFRIQYPLLRPYECLAGGYVQFPSDLLDGEQVLRVKTIAETPEAMLAADISNGGAAERDPPGATVPFGVQHCGDTAVVVGVEQGVDPIDRLPASAKQFGRR